MTVNEMIIEAITTDSRKRKCRWQTELEALGFKISKDRAWCMTEKYNSRKWIAFCWFMGLVTLANILAFVCMFMHYDYPEVIVDILVLCGLITAGYCGINVLNKKVNNIVPPEEKGEEDGTCKN